jgi:hypothetical protein
MRTWSASSSLSLARGGELNGVQQQAACTVPDNDDDELKPGIDKPRRGQYVIGVLVIFVLSALAYWRLGWRQ